MCLGTFWRLRRSLATSSLYAAVRILPEAFCIIGNAISYYTKKQSEDLPSDLSTALYTHLIFCYAICAPAPASALRTALATAKAATRDTRSFTRYGADPARNAAHAPSPVTILS